MRLDFMAGPRQHPATFFSSFPTRKLDGDQDKQKKNRSRRRSWIGNARGRACLFVCLIVCCFQSKARPKHTYMINDFVNPTALPSASGDSDR